MKEIRAEKRLGSTSLASRCLDSLRLLALEAEAGSPEAFGRIVEETVSILSRLRPSMPIIARTAAEVLKRYGQRSAYASSVEDAREALRESCSEVERTYERMLDSLISHASRVLSSYDSVSTLSHSGTLKKVISSSPSLRNIFLLESRPMLEGRGMAMELAREKHVEMVVDAACSYAVDKSQAVLLGADALFSDGSFSGKVGCRPVCVVANEASRPVYVACDTWKLVGREGYVVEEGEPDEVWTDRGSVLVRNPYFEVVPCRYVTAYLTDLGVYSPSQIRELGHE